MSLVAHQFRYDMKAFWRNRQARFFTLGLPVGMLILFVAIFGQTSYLLGGERVGGSTYYVANLVGFGTVDAAMMSMAIGIVLSRETGIMKRQRATPLPAWVIVVSRALAGIVTALVLAAVLLVVGRMAYSVSVPLHSLLALVLVIVVGTFAFCSLGFAASGFITNVDAAQPVMMAVALPLFFISGIFVPWPFIPSWLQSVAQVFPVRHFAAAVLAPLAPAAGSGVHLLDLAVVALWGAVGLFLATRTFRWVPSH